MVRRYFGTDGIRGRVGEAPMTPEFVLKLGWALGRALASGRKDTVLIGKDTRISGYLLESALEAGLSAAGANIKLLGPMPTPGIAYLTRTLRAAAGIVISASHNPFYDNGVKIFSASGSKLPDSIEAEIEALLEQPLETVESAALGKAERLGDAAGRYIEFCKSTVPSGTNLRGLKIVVDCANGATYHVAPNVFEELGAKVIRIGNRPDGLNINESCGATDTALLQATVRAENANLGIALDGDGDRVIMVDEHGAAVDGDELLYILAMGRYAKDPEFGGVVGTVMSNLGLEQALDSRGIPFERAAVGDRYVLERMGKRGWNLGGEGSGHIICLDKTSTGDGIVSSLQVLIELINTQQSLSEAKAGMCKFPQLLINVPVSNGQGKRILGLASVQSVVHEAETQLVGEGRVLLRPSGTEPIVRVMVEGRNADLVRSCAEMIAASVSLESETADAGGVSV